MNFRPDNHMLGARTVTSKTRKRCLRCSRMVEAGMPAKLTDDRYLSARLQDFGRQYARGAWHLWHVECWQEREAAELRCAIYREIAGTDDWLEFAIRHGNGGWA